MVFTDAQIRRAIRNVLERPTRPLDGDQGQPDTDERYLRTLAYVYVQFLLYPKLTYTLGTVSRDRLLSSTRKISGYLEEAIVRLSQVKLGDANYDLDSLTQASEAANRFRAFDQADFAPQARRVREKLNKFVSKLKPNIDGNRALSLNAIENSLEPVFTDLPLLFDRINYLLRLNEQVDYIGVRDFVSRFILRNIAALLEADVALVDGGTPQQDMEEIVLDVLAAQAALNSIELRKEPNDYYVRSAPTIEGRPQIERASPIRTNYRAYHVGPIDNPLCVVPQSEPHIFPFEGGEVENLLCLKLTVRDVETSAILSEIERPFPEYQNFAYGKKLVAEKQVSAATTTNDAVTLLVRVDDDTAIVSIPAATTIVAAMALINAELVPLGARCQWHMGRAETRRLCIYADIDTRLEFVGAYVETIGPAPFTVTTYVNTAAEQLGWKVGQPAIPSYTAEDLAFYFNLSDIFGDQWVARVGGSAPNYVEDYFGNLVSTRFGNTGIPEDYSDLTVSFESIDNPLSPGNIITVVRFSEAIDVKSGGYHLLVQDGPNRGRYQLAIAIDYDTLDKAYLWQISEFGFVEGKNLVAHSEPVPARLDSRHFEFQLLGDWGTEIKAEAEWGCHSQVVFMDYLMEVMNDMWPYRNHIEFAGPRPDKKGTWRFDFGTAGVRRGDILKFSGVIGNQFAEFEGNLIDAVVDSDQSFSNEEDRIDTNRRIKISAYLPTVFQALPGSIRSSYRYWHEQMTQSMVQFLNYWLRGQYKSLWYVALSNNDFQRIVDTVFSEAREASGRAKLAQELANVYDSLLLRDSRERLDEVEAALTKFHIRLRSRGEVRIPSLEEVLLTYSPPDGNAPERGAMLDTFSFLTELGYDRARDLLMDLNLPEFFNLDENSTSYASSFSNQLIQVMQQMPVSRYEDHYQADTIDGDIAPDDELYDGE